MRYFSHILVLATQGKTMITELNPDFFEDLDFHQPDFILMQLELILERQSTETLSLDPINLWLNIDRMQYSYCATTNSYLSAISAQKDFIFQYFTWKRVIDGSTNACRRDKQTYRRSGYRLMWICATAWACSGVILMRRAKWKERTYVIGSPIAEVLSEHIEEIESSTTILERFRTWEKGKYILLSCPSWRKKTAVILKWTFF